VAHDAGGRGGNHAGYLPADVLGYFLVAQAVVPHLLDAGHGKIINISVSDTTPDDAPDEVQATWLDPPVVWLASRASDGQTDQRIVAKEFAASPPA
jgi:hypothetical protein